MKDYDISINTFYYIKIEGLYPFNSTFWHIYYNLSFIYIYIYIYIYSTQTKLETQHTDSYFFPQKTNK